MPGIDSFAREIFRIGCRERATCALALISFCKTRFAATKSIIQLPSFA